MRKSLSAFEASLIVTPRYYLARIGDQLERLMTSTATGGYRTKEATPPSLKDSIEVYVNNKRIKKRLKKERI